MKTYAVTVTVYVQGKTADEALRVLTGELDEVCNLDNPVLAVSYPDASEVKEEAE